MHKGKVANNTETALLKWITFSPTLTLPLHSPKIMYKISVRAFAIDWLFVYLFPRGVQEVILEPLVDVEEAICRGDQNRIMREYIVLWPLSAYIVDSISDFLLLQHTDVKYTVIKPN